MADISNSHKRARLSITSEPLPSTSVNGVIKELETFTKSQSVAPKVLSRPIRQITTIKQRPSEVKSKNTFTVQLAKCADAPTLVPPENGALYTPMEAYTSYGKEQKT